MSEFSDVFFTDTVAVYRQRKRTLGDLVYNATPVISSLSCALQATENVDTLTGPLGLKKEDNIFTLDVLYCAVGTDIRGQDVIKITTAGHPMLNHFYQVMGDPKQRPSKFVSDLGYAKVYLNAITGPETILVPTPG